jgi:hypothetical protein
VDADTSGAAADPAREQAESVARLCLDSFALAVAAVVTALQPEMLDTTGNGEQRTSALALQSIRDVSLRYIVPPSPGSPAGAAFYSSGAAGVPVQWAAAVAVEVGAAPPLLVVPAVEWNAAAASGSPLVVTFSDGLVPTASDVAEVITAAVHRRELARLNDRMQRASRDFVQRLGAEVPSCAVTVNAASAGAAISDATVLVAMLHRQFAPGSGILGHALASLARALTRGWPPRFESLFLRRCIRSLRVEFTRAARPCIVRDGPVAIAARAPLGASAAAASTAIVPLVDLVAWLPLDDADFEPPEMSTLLCSDLVSIAVAVLCDADLDELRVMEGLSALDPTSAAAAAAVAATHAPAPAFCPWRSRVRAAATPTEVARRALAATSVTVPPDQDAVGYVSITMAPCTAVLGAACGGVKRAGAPDAYGALGPATLMLPPTLRDWADSGRLRARWWLRAGANGAVPTAATPYTVVDARIVTARAAATREFKTRKQRIREAKARRARDAEREAARATHSRSPSPSHPTAGAAASPVADRACGVALRYMVSVPRAVAAAQSRQCCLELCVDGVDWPSATVRVAREVLLDACGDRIDATLRLEAPTFNTTVRGEVAELRIAYVGARRARHALDFDVEPIEGPQAADPATGTPAVPMPPTGGRAQPIATRRLAARAVLVTLGAMHTADHAAPDDTLAATASAVGRGARLRAATAGEGGDGATAKVAAGKGRSKGGSKARANPTGPLWHTPIDVAFRVTATGPNGVVVRSVIAFSAECWSRRGFLAWRRALLFSLDATATRLAARQRVLQQQLVTKRNNARAAFERGMNVSVWGRTFPANFYVRDRAMTQPSDAGSRAACIDATRVMLPSLI